MKLEAQNFDGVLEVTCIEGGPITQLEAQEMARIMKEATRDCAKSGISVQYSISLVSFYEFLQQHDPTPAGGVREPEPELVPADVDHPVHVNDCTSSFEDYRSLHKGGEGGCVLLEPDE
eukprot:SAG22_NODE_931_length_6450_cov_2.817981_3_plen_119_part_00